jgi:hypothetical protein
MWRRRAGNPPRHAADRARAVVNVLDACRSDAVQFEPLAIAVCIISRERSLQMPPRLAL